ncbi:hypothetical protein [Vibrio diazotrophicus]|uniref:hypothetical protein n=1 Tax=Vibrio diazotrophicus TaxID=685 RepID=UPI000C9E9427|nr:hypothetical protein [Vibrio diazotrophicus]PNH77628.1 hypothetical protein C1N27_20415 [Vibrio diazotrophicus]
MNTKEMKKISKIFKEWSLDFKQVGIKDDYEFYYNLSSAFKCKNTSMNFCNVIDKDVQVKLINYLLTITSFPLNKEIYEEATYIMEVIQKDIEAL